MEKCGVCKGVKKIREWQEVIDCPNCEGTGYDKPIKRLAEDLKKDLNIKFERIKEEKKLKDAKRKQKDSDVDSVSESGAAV